MFHLKCYAVGLALVTFAAGCASDPLPCARADLAHLVGFDIADVTEHRETIGTDALPRALQRALRGLKCGMTRQDVYKSFEADGGFNQVHFERSLWLRPFEYHGEKKRLMIYLVYRPYAMDRTIFEDLEKRVAWITDHRPAADYRDILVGCSAPFLADGPSVD